MRGVHSITRSWFTGRPMAGAGLRAAGATVLGVLAAAGTGAWARPAPWPPHMESLDGAVQALVPFAGELIAAGSFSTAGALHTGPLARWTGSGWAALGAPFDGSVQALAVVQGQLVAAGAFTHVGTTAAAHIARWNGNGWEALGAGTNGPVHALAVQAGVALFVGGAFDQAGGGEAHGVARWIAGTWSAVGNGVDGEVRALAVYDGVLVAAGDFGTRDSGGLDLHLARFVGGAWRTLALGVDAPVSALTVYQGSLIAGGAFTAIDLVTPARGVARLTGDAWSELGVGVTSAGAAEVLALWAAGDTLIAGGRFESAGLSRMNNIARWDGTRWNALQTGTDGPVAAIAELADGLVAAGSFAHAGDAAARSIAAFRSGRWVTLDETPVTVRDVEAGWEEARVRVQWRLDAGAAAELQGVQVQRAARPDQNGVAVTPLLLVPTVEMTVLDGAPDPARRWYRIVLVRRDGGRALGATIQAPAYESARRASGVTSIEHAPDGSIHVGYAISAAGPARLAVYDVRGRLLATLAGGPHAVGAYRAVWLPGAGAGRARVEGVYFASLHAADGSTVRKFAAGAR